MWHSVFTVLATDCSDFLSERHKGPLWDTDPGLGEGSMPGGLCSRSRGHCRAASGTLEKWRHGHLRLHCWRCCLGPQVLTSPLATPCCPVCCSLVTDIVQKLPGFACLKNQPFHLYFPIKKTKPNKQKNYFPFWPRRRGKNQDPTVGTSRGLWAPPTGWHLLLSLLCIICVI